MKVVELAQGKICPDIAVQEEEEFRISSSYLIAEVIDSTRSS